MLTFGIWLIVIWCLRRVCCRINLAIIHLLWFHPAMVDCCVWHTLISCIWLNVTQLIGLSHIELNPQIHLHFTNPTKNAKRVNCWFCLFRAAIFSMNCDWSGGVMPRLTYEFHIFAKKIVKWEPSQLTIQQNQRPILPLIYSRVVQRLRGVVVGEFKGALPGEVDEMKIFVLGVSVMVPQILPKGHVDRHPQLIRSRRWVSVEGRRHGGGLIPLDGRELGDGMGWCYGGCENIFCLCESLSEIRG